MYVSKETGELAIAIPIVKGWLQVERILINRIQINTYLGRLDFDVTSAGVHEILTTLHSVQFRFRKCRVFLIGGPDSEHVHMHKWDVF